MGSLDFQVSQETRIQMSKVNDHWTTADEINFLEKCGRWNWKNRIDPENRKRLLENYRKHMKERADWGEINSFEVECYVEKELAVFYINGF